MTGLVAHEVGNQSMEGCRPQSQRPSHRALGKGRCCGPTQQWAYLGRQPQAAARCKPASMPPLSTSPFHCRFLQSASRHAPGRWRGGAATCSSALYEGHEPRVAAEGDTVSLHYSCLDEQGQKLESSHDANEPLTFELGAGEVFANPVFKAFDEAVRGLAIGERAYLRCGGGKWEQELLFEVECTHPEIQRLERRYKNVGGLAAGLVVELSNGTNAVVLAITEHSVQLDANSMLAGKQLVFELDLISIE